ncbi:hypothetical protein VTN00DRAFT_3138 [Thermoascus crustaceus]|uniref:uncharacterized protein n=1 Tax=Thermoascus crustaceus TaxID=5088 RepID=UPI00374372E3
MKNLYGAIPVAVLAAVGKAEAMAQAAGASPMYQASTTPTPAAKWASGVDQHHYDRPKDHGPEHVYVYPVHYPDYDSHGEKDKAHGHGHEDVYYNDWWHYYESHGDVDHGGKHYEHDWHLKDSEFWPHLRSRDGKKRHDGYPPVWLDSHNEIKLHADGNDDSHHTKDHPDPYGNYNNGVIEFGPGHRKRDGRKMVGSAADHEHHPDWHEHHEHGGERDHASKDQEAKSSIQNWFQFVGQDGVADHAAYQAEHDQHLHWSEHEHHDHLQGRNEQHHPVNHPDWDAHGEYDAGKAHSNKDEFYNDWWHQYAQHQGAGAAATHGEHDEHLHPRDEQHGQGFAPHSESQGEADYTHGHAGKDQFYNDWWHQYAQHQDAGAAATHGEHDEHLHARSEGFGPDWDAHGEVDHAHGHADKDQFYNDWWHQYAQHQDAGVATTHGEHDEHLHARDQESSQVIAPVPYPDYDSHDEASDEHGHAGKDEFYNDYWHGYANLQDADVDAHHDEHEEHAHDGRDDCPSAPVIPVIKTVTATEVHTFCPHGKECEHHHHHEPTPSPLPVEKTETVYTTVFKDLCETGLTHKTYTVTEKCPCSAHRGPDHIPEGFTATVKTCHTCGPHPIVATVTVPISEAVPTGAAPVYTPGGPSWQVSPSPTPTPTAWKPAGHHPPHNNVVPFTGGAGSYSSAGIAMSVVAAFVGALAVIL